MNVNVMKPYWLLLFAVIVVLLYVIAKKGNLKNTFQRRFFVFIRSIVALLLILALCDVSIQTTSQKVTTIFAVDLSDSAKQSQQDIKTFLKQAESMTND